MLQYVYVRFRVLTQFFTGAMDIALGQGATGVFTNSATLWHYIFQVRNSDTNTAAFLSFWELSRKLFFFLCIHHFHVRSKKFLTLSCWSG